MKKDLTQILRHATDLPPAEREEFLRSVCENDEHLRTAIDEALAMQSAATLVDRPAGPAHTPTDPSAFPRTLGRYTLLDVLGEGGMGTVYLAEQESPRRSVALKVLRPGLVTPRLLRRFEHESLVLGRLQHPGIAQVYEAATADTGSGPQPYFAMELVRGLPLTVHANSHDLPLPDRLRLFVRVCEAVEHAHQKGVIHRDLKPANIMVDASGQPKVLDFGVARAADADVRSATLMTEVGQLVGTVPYMSPEQIAGDTSDLDTRSDVYTLGVVLYELLSGQLPHRVSDKTLPEAVRIIGQEEPVALGSIDRALRGDLQTIVGKALDKERARRYQSAADLGEDIERYLRDEPITARPPTRLYQFSKFARRNRGLVAASVLALLLLVVATAGISWQAFAATRERNLARTEAANARAVSIFLRDMLQAVNPDQNNPREVTVREMIDRAAATVDASGVDTPRVEVTIRHTLAGSYRSLGMPSTALPHALKAVELARATLGPDHPDTIDAERNLAITHAELAQFDQALPLLQHSVEALAHDPTNPAFAAATGELARVYFEQGDAARAEPLIREAIRLGTAAAGRLDESTLVSMDHLGTLLTSQGRFAEAEAQLRTTLAARETVHGLDSPITAYTLTSLANVLQKQGNNEEAVTLLERVLKIRRERLEPGHPSTLITLSNLAVAYIGLNRITEAETLLRESVNAQREKLGLDHPKTLIAMGNLAYLLEDSGRLDEAETLFREVVAARRRGGLTDPESLPQINNLAMLLHKKGTLEEAIALLEEAANLAQASLPAEHYLTAILRNNLGMMLTDAGRLDDAHRQLTQSHATLATFFGESHARTKASRLRLAALYDKMGRPEEAQRLRSVDQPR
ncbi:MAG: serine/threonine protein kinase [Phycisphaerales bacterium]|nr:serine/threonine protein kinase [Phycisphaerales bacterium]